MEVLEVRTRQREELVDITGKVQDLVRGAAVQEGVLHLWSMHTTCALTVNESADPSVPVDIAGKMGRLVPEGESFYRHAEGNSDSHADCSGEDCSASPVPVIGMTDATLLSAGGAHSCAIKTDGTTWCWGFNDRGQLGNGTDIDAHTPTPVSNINP